jgi:hypothetical protein
VPLWRSFAPASSEGAKSPNPDTGPTLVAERPGEGTLVGNLAPPVSRSSVLPLPREDEAVTSFFDDLYARVRRGDARAGCRLARELQRCKYSKHHPGNAAAAIDWAAKAEDGPVLDQAVEMVSRIEGTRPAAVIACQGLTEEHLDRRFEVLQRTAELGHLPSMVEFAQGRAFFDFDYVRHPQRFVAWQSVAQAYMERALSLGSSDALLAYMLAYSSDAGLFEALVPDDVALAHAMQLVLARTVVGFKVINQGYLPDDQLERAIQVADYLYDKHFSTKPAIPRDRLFGGSRDPYSANAADCEDA